MGRQCSVRTGTLAGVEVLPVDVELDVGAGLPTFAIVGLPDAAVQEARERVRSAIRASGFELPNARIVVNLAPGPLRKHGTGFDLPIAVGILVATGQFPAAALEGLHVVGELSLDGRIRPVPGLLAHALHARSAGATLLAAGSAGEHLCLPALDFRGLRNLSQLRQGLPDRVAPISPRDTQRRPDDLDFSQVVGQDAVVRALVAAAAGDHNILLVGPPGAGKTMLARRLPTILPPLDENERLQTALIHSVAGHDERHVLEGIRPFRAPHHTCSTAGLVGGGVPPRPGEASLAHNGVLFLDEMPEFGPAALQCLRQPLEDGCITIVRAEGRLRFPALFVLVGAANPCPCGHHGDPGRACECTPTVLARYRARIGGPLMDRIDMVCNVWRPASGLLLDGEPSQTSVGLLTLVREARERACARSPTPTSRLSGAPLLDACRLDADGRELIERMASVHHLSGRGITRLLRVARTVADLEGSDRVRCDDLAEAAGYRGGGEGR